MSRNRPIAIVGGGPAGCALGALLAKAGRNVTLFTNDKRPGLVVGESLIPGSIPVLRKLGIEDDVKAFSEYKPGASFHDGTVEVFFDFSTFGGKLPQYAYNVPRDRFDAALLDTAVAHGVRVVHRRAELEPVTGSGAVALDQASQAEIAGLKNGETPFVVDATGRTRLVSKVLGIRAVEGGRKDAALFAHLDTAEISREGYIHLNRLPQGWSWRIPLPGKMSVGVVIDSKYVKDYGATIDEQYDAMLKGLPPLDRFTKNSTRISPVMKYTNYQLVSTKMAGPNWALCGDAAGFIDPIFSSGVFLSLDGADRLAQALLDGSDAALQRYEKRYQAHLKAWRRVISYYYTGHLFTLFHVGEDRGAGPVSQWINAHVHRNVGRIFIGEATTKTYSRKLLDFMVTHALDGKDPKELAIN